MPKGAHDTAKGQARLRLPPRLLSHPPLRIGGGESARSCFPSYIRRGGATAPGWSSGELLAQPAPRRRPPLALVLGSDVAVVGIDARDAAGRRAAFQRQVQISDRR